MEFACPHRTARAVPLKVSALGPEPSGEAIEVLRLTASRRRQCLFLHAEDRSMLRP